MYINFNGKIIFIWLAMVTNLFYVLCQYMLKIVHSSKIVENTFANK